jgi:hypothetical protein
MSCKITTFINVLATHSIFLEKPKIIQSINNQTVFIRKQIFADA